MRSTHAEMHAASHPPLPPGVAAVVGLFWSLFSAEGRNWTVWGSALMLLASRASQVYFQVGGWVGGGAAGLRMGPSGWRLAGLGVGAGGGRRAGL